MSTFFLILWWRWKIKCKNVHYKTADNGSKLFCRGHPLYNGCKKLNRNYVSLYKSRKILQILFIYHLKRTLHDFYDTFISAYKWNFDEWHKQETVIYIAYILKMMNPDCWPIVSWCSDHIRTLPYLKQNLRQQVHVHVLHVFRT